MIEFCGGDYTGVVPPVPISNTEVKYTKADGSVMNARVGSHHQRTQYKKPPKIGGFCLQKARSHKPHHPIGDAEFSIFNFQSISKFFNFQLLFKNLVILVLIDNWLLRIDHSDHSQSDAAGSYSL